MFDRGPPLDWSDDWIKSSPAVPGGSLVSKPTWRDTSECSATSAFFVLDRYKARRSAAMERHFMENLNSNAAQQIAQAAIAFHQQQTGHRPQSVAVVLSGDMLVITLHGALSAAEKALARSPQAAAQVQEFHRQLFHVSVGQLQKEIEKITGVEVREATTEVETKTGTVVQVFTTGTMVQVFSLARAVPADSWSGQSTGNRVQEMDVLSC